jgi:hypothetical protein
MNAAGTLIKPIRGLILASGLVAATSVASLAADVTVPFGTAPTSTVANAYLNPPTGTAVLGGHTFDLTTGKMIALVGGQSAVLTGSYPNTKAAYILFNSYNTWLSYGGATIGTVVLTFSDGTTQSTNLIVGTNLREWRPAGTNTVNTATGAGWSNVWTGQAQPTAGGGTAVIDLLTITVVGTGKTLTSITITNSDLGGPNGVGVISPAVTVDDGPIALPGSGDEVGNHSGNHDNQDINKVNRPTKKAPVTVTPVAPKPVASKPADIKQGDGDTNNQSSSADHGRSRD